MPPKVMPTYPDDHEPLVATPRGGSSCANCKFVDSEAHTCGSPDYRAYYSTDKLPDRPLDAMCSDWWEPPGGLVQIKSRGDAIARLDVITEHGGKFYVYNEARTRVLPYDTRAEAEDRLRQVEFFKHTRDAAPHGHDDRHTVAPLVGRTARDNAVAQMAVDYPPAATEWARDATWYGPVAVTLDDIDMRNREGWSANDDPKKVKKFAKRIAAGWQRPAILVKRPDNDKLMIADGHHRVLACERCGHKVVAYVAAVPTATGPWDEMHDSQRRGGKQS